MRNSAFVADVPHLDPLAKFGEAVFGVSMACCRVLVSNSYRAVAVALGKAVVAVRIAEVGVGLASYSVAVAFVAAAVAAMDSD